jgi:hypothetical protein
VLSVIHHPEWVSSEAPNFSHAVRIKLQQQVGTQPAAGLRATRETLSLARPRVLQAADT